VGESLDRILVLAGDLRSEIPGWEGSIGPSPVQYAIPHVYARSVHSGAGNCVCGRDFRHPIHVQIAPGVTLSDVLEEAMLELASVQVPQYTRASSRGNLVRVSGYSRMGMPGQQEHLVNGHGMHPTDFGQDFHHPQGLADWHAFDHFARGAGGGGGGAMSSASSLGHAHPRPLARAERSAGHADGHGGGEHGLHGLGISHMAAWEGPVLVHRETRRTLDRQVRRGFYRHVERHGHGGAARGPQGASKGAQGGSGSSGSSGGGSSSSSSSGSSSRGGSRGY
jgi:hypothetical protein